MSRSHPSFIAEELSVRARKASEIHYRITQMLRDIESRANELEAHVDDGSLEDSQAVLRELRDMRAKLAAGFPGLKSCDCRNGCIECQGPDPEDFR